jgi:hypothetical protein
MEHRIQSVYFSLILTRPGISRNYVNLVPIKSAQYVPEERNKNRLDLMAERSGVRISDMLEKLINEHYRKMIGGE